VPGPMRLGKPARDPQIREGDFDGANQRAQVRSGESALMAFRLTGSVDWRQ